MIRNSQHNKGFTLIEALVAFIVLSAGLIGTVAMQAVAKRNSFDAAQRAQAMTVANDIVERMRANNEQGAAFLAGYNGKYGAGQAVVAAPAQGCSAVGSNCSADQIRAADRFEWSQRLLGTDVMRGESAAGGISDAVGCVNINADGAVTVVIAWQGRESIRDAATQTGENDCGTAGDTRRQLVVSTFIY